MSTAAINTQGCATHEDIKNYYGKVLQKTNDLKTDICISRTTTALPAYVKNTLEDIHEDIVQRFYGCDFVIPECLKDCRVLDLGSGSGRDCFMLSKLVGEGGHVTGIDMTSEQIAIARKYIDHHTEKFGFSRPNVEFIQGYIEDLKEAGIKDESFDVLVSNGAINLTLDKEIVMKECFRVLKDGGEVYLCDVYASFRLPPEIRSNKILWGECLGGALWWKDLTTIAVESGFSIPRLVTSKPIAVKCEELQAIVGDCKFATATYRLFKIPKSYPREKCQVMYNGSIKGHEKELKLDSTNTFKQGEDVEVDEETAAILKNSRFREAFTIKLPKGSKDTAQSFCNGQQKEIITDPFLLIEKLQGSGGGSGKHNSEDSCCG